MFKEFKEFILRGNVVELAVAVVIGAAFTSVIEAVVDLITNLIAIFRGKPQPGEPPLAFKIGEGVFNYGNLIDAIIAFLIVAAVIFFLIVRPLNRLAERRRVGAEPEPEARPDDVLLLEEIRDLLRAQQSPARTPRRAAGRPADPEPT